MKGRVQDILKNIFFSPTTPPTVQSNRSLTFLPCGEAFSTARVEKGINERRNPYAPPWVMPHNWCFRFLSMRDAATFGHDLVVPALWAAPSPRSLYRYTGNRYRTSAAVVLLSREFVG